MAQDKPVVGNKHMHLDINGPLGKIHPIVHALSSELRLQIIRRLGARSMNVGELSAALDVPMSTVSLNLSVLEKAGLVNGEAQAGARGTMKLCSRMTDLITINLAIAEDRPNYVGEVRMPVGYYSMAGEIRPTCGLAGPERIIGGYDNPMAFFLPEHFGAQLIWFREGFLEYCFPTMPFYGILLTSIEISFEACSEAVNYRPEWPSDISMAINGVKIGSWLSPGDLGGRRGLLNPKWWSDSSTQFGHLVTWRVDEEGSYVDHARISDVKLSDLRLDVGNHFTLRIGVDASAAHVGGMNLFGSEFGDFKQDILLRYTYR